MAKFTPGFYAKNGGLLDDDRFYWYVYNQEGLIVARGNSSSDYYATQAANDAVKKLLAQSK